jgi:hypothetical protein
MQLSDIDTRENNLADSEPQRAKSKLTKASFVSAAFFILLAVVLATAFISRFLLTTKGIPYLHHWDEPLITKPAFHMLKTGDYNPHEFTYGSLIVYMNFAVFVLHFFSLLGKPDEAEAFIRNANEIQTWTESGWMWTASHPTFYVWGRCITVVLATLTVILCYKMGKDLLNRWAGLIAALLLATNSYHIFLSAQIAADVPAAFFSLLAVYTAFIFARSGELKYFIVSLVACGLTPAIKYNSGLVVVAPVIALATLGLTRSKAYNHWLWLLVPIIPGIALFAAMPYAVLDLPQFLNDAGYQVYHYKVLGHGAETSTPGWDNLTFQSRETYKHFGFLVCVFAALGGLVTVTRKWGWLLWPFPIIFVYYMLQMRTNFHRNYIGMYPFIALFAGVGIVWLYLVIERNLNKQVRKEYHWRFPAAALGLLFIVSCFMAAKPLAEGRATWLSRDSRTVAVDRVNSLMGTGMFDDIVIARELDFHSYDLRRMPTEKTSIALIGNMVPPEETGKRTLYLVPTELSTYQRSEEEAKAISELYQVALAGVQRNIVDATGGGTTNLDIFSVSPGIFFTSRPPRFRSPDNASPPVWGKPRW